MKIRPQRLQSSTGVCRLLVLALLAVVATSGMASAQLDSRRQKASLEVYTDRSAYEPGESARLAARVKIDEGWHLQSHEPSLEYLIPTVLSAELPPGWSLGQIDYPPDSLWQAQFETEPLAVYEGELVIHAIVRIPADAGADGRSSHDFEVRLDYQACDDRVCLAPTFALAPVAITLGSDGEPQHTELFEGDETGGRGTGSGTPLLPTLLLGLLGGLILNAMPCVLPVLSLKIFGLVKEAGHSRRAVTTGALATSFGILFSFWVLAALAIGTRAAGQAVGWGIQFQNPGFVAFLAIVLVFFTLNLWGLFEIPMPGVLAKVGGGSGGLAGHFTTGLFTTLMATPCSAPYLGPAVGFALSQSGATILLVFTAVGLGMALPYLLVAVAPGSVGWLPKPGAWMESLKVVMGFLLAGAVVWLLYVLNAQIRPEHLAFFEASLLAVGLFAWWKGRRGPGRGWAPVTGMIAASLIAIFIATNSEAATTDTPLGSRIAWTEFDERRAEEIAAAGGLVFVDVTADWCATCKINERFVLETDDVVEAFERHQVHAMRADWTNRNDVISDYLERFGRYAIPFYVLYRPHAEPHVFGELLTRKTVLDVVTSSASGDRQIAERSVSN